MLNNRVRKYKLQKYKSLTLLHALSWEKDYTTVTQFYTVQSKNNISWLQRVQNALARDKKKSSYHHSASTATLASHPTDDRIQSGNVGVQDSRDGSATLLETNRPTQGNITNSAKVRRRRVCFPDVRATKSDSASWAFSFVVSIAWNNLPSDLRRSS